VEDGYVTARRGLEWIDPRLFEGRRVLRVRDLALPGEGAELLGPSAPHGLDQLGLRVADEVLEGRRFAVLLAHEDQGQEGREQQQRPGQLLLLEAEQAAEALAQQTVAHLIVVLNRDDE